MTTPADISIPLTRGLMRNTLYNLVGWIWPVLLAFVSVPYIVSSLGNEAYGIFGIMSIVGGYLGLLSQPIAMGNVRFMAEAYARQDWDEFRKIAATGVVVMGALAALGAGIMFIAASVLANNVFKIPGSLVDTAIKAFRIASATFFLNGIVGSLKSIPTARRRYGILNIVNSAVVTLNTAGIVLALWLGWGLIGAVSAQFLSSILALICFAVIASLGSGKLKFFSQMLHPDGYFIKKLISFSSVLFLMRVVSTIGLQIDRTLIGMILGVSAVTFYTIPARITDQIPLFMVGFTTTLYPLSAESAATGRLDELRTLYLKVEGLLLWASAFLGVVLILLSREILTLWISPELAAESHWVLVFLTGAAVLRAPGSIAYQITTGLGRPDVPLWTGLISVVVMTLGTLLLIKPYGITGVAIGIFILMIPLSLGFDLFTQRRLLQQQDWQVSLMLYARPLIGSVATIAFFRFFLANLTDFAVSWWTLLIKGILVAIIYLIFSLVAGALNREDIRLILRRLQRGLIKSTH